jgi:hypothetical protein
MDAKTWHTKLDDILQQVSTLMERGEYIAAAVWLGMAIEKNNRFMRLNKDKDEYENG